MVINRIKRATAERRAASPAPLSLSEASSASVDAEAKTDGSELSSDPPSPLSVGAVTMQQVVAAGKGVVVAERSRDSSGSSTCSEATMSLAAD